MNAKNILLDQNVKTVENILTITNNRYSHNEERYECEDCTKYFFAQNQHHLSKCTQQNFEKSCTTVKKVACRWCCSSLGH